MERYNLQDVPRLFSVGIQHINDVKKEEEGSPSHDIDHTYELEEFPRTPYWFNDAG